MGDMSDYINESHEVEFICTGSIKYKTCKYCGKGGFIWKQVDGRWRLFKGGKVHNCPKHPSKLMEDYEIET